MSTIPIIDFARASSSSEEVARDLLQACTDWGFFYVKNHPISQDAIDGIFELERRFFAQSDALKSKAPYVPQKNAGFMPASSYSANGKLTDPREKFSINKWPSEEHKLQANLPPILNIARDQIAGFQSQVHDFTTRLLELVALSLDLPANQFTVKHDRQKENFDNFELMHYPPVELDTVKGNPFRISPHTDWGTLTLLFQKDVGGLEVRPPSSTAAELDLEHETWTPAPVFNDMILINIADMLEFWTAGRLKSTWHRVVPTSQFGGLDRYTFAYFLHPNKDAVLIPIEALKKEDWIPRYEGIGRTAEEHIHARIRGVHGPSSTTEAKNKVAVTVKEVGETAT